jgi:hypothetical protein
MSLQRIKKRKVAIKDDPNLDWVKEDYPQLEPWRNIGIQWLRSSKVASTYAIAANLIALSHFYEKFLIRLNLPSEPLEFFRKSDELPDFFEQCCTNNIPGRQYNNRIYYFLDFVIEQLKLKKVEFDLLNPIKWRSEATGEPSEKKSIFQRPSRKEIPIALDKNLEWVELQYPILEKWRKFAINWLNSMKSTENSLRAIQIFFERYIISLDLPLDPMIYLSRDKVFPDFFEVALSRTSKNVQFNNAIYHFLDYIISTELLNENEYGIKTVNMNLENPIKWRNLKTFEISHKGQMGVTASSDLELTWVNQEYPQLEYWRTLAKAWLEGEPRGLGTRLHGLGIFFKDYLIDLRLPLDPEIFFSKSTQLPDFNQVVAKTLSRPHVFNNNIHSFLEFIIRKQFSTRDIYGDLVVNQGSRNPVPWVSSGGERQNDESVYSPLDYVFLDELRQILASGSNFGDWKWAQNALGGEIGVAGGGGNPDWFPVTESEIDKTDPDCVFRIRERSQYRGDLLEMWSPVRWVALLVKLLVPLRTSQVRWLDSGEADTWRYKNKQWVRNPNRMAEGNASRSHQNGVFRKLNERKGKVGVQLYINTNKTADIQKYGAAKGYTVPWPALADLPVQDQVYYWLEKIRNWQEKYNPISRRTSWNELDDRHLRNAKSKVQLAEYPDTCFLFRLPEARQKNERHLPVSAGIFARPWYVLLEELENRLASSNRTHDDGTKIELVAKGDDSNKGTLTYFPLHSLRVSLITAFALEGKLPFPILSKAVGHSRLLMTLHYIVAGEANIAEALATAAGILRAKSLDGTTSLNWLKNVDHKKLLDEAIGIDPHSISAAIQVDTRDRNAARWKDVGNGICLVGGNTTPIPDNAKAGGCFNGGPAIGRANGVDLHGPVPGGPRNCLRCRWFVTSPSYLAALAATFNNYSWNLEETLIKLQDAQLASYRLRAEMYDAEKAHQPILKFDELKKLDRLVEKHAAEADILGHNVAQCWFLADKCNKKLKDFKNNEKMMLLSLGTIQDVQMVVDETPSQLLHASGVCEGLELYPELQITGSNSAIWTRSQILDAALVREGRKPLFMHLSEEEQLRSASYAIAMLAQSINPEHPDIGKRQVVSLIDAGERIFDMLGIEIDKIIPKVDDNVTLNIHEKNRSSNVLHDRNPPR